jgi:DNA polymerase III epsilon subunit-like protein
MREIIIDTETTGLDPLGGHRIVEIGAVELLDHAPTGRTFHCLERPRPINHYDVEGAGGWMSNVTVLENRDSLFETTNMIAAHLAGSPRDD